MTDGSHEDRHATEVAADSDPLIIRAFLSDEFMQSARQVAAALGVDDSWIARIRDPFVLLVDGAGLWLCPDDAELEPYVSIGWPIVGTLRDGWGPRGGKGETAAGIVFTVLTLGELGVAGRDTVPAVFVPISSPSGAVELEIPVDSDEGIARNAERRRPRTARGPMLQWVPD